MRTKKLILSRLIGCTLLGLGLNLVTSLNLEAGTFQSDFNSGVPPAGMTLYGTAQNYDHSTGGKTGGCLKLTDSTINQTGGAIIDDFDNGAIIGGFDATFQLFIGGGSGADGMSFAFGDFANSAWPEEGPGTMKGLTIVFDEYNNGGTPAEAPAIDVKWDNVTVFHRLVGAVSATSPASPIGTATTIRTQTTSGGAPVYVPVKIHVDTDGTLDLVYNNVVIVTNFPIFRAMTDPPLYGYRFGFGARTGGSADNHWIDDLLITTYPVDASSGQPYITSISPVPVGANAGAAGGVVVELKDGTFSVNPATVKMNYTNTTVTPTVTQDAGVTRIAYRGSSAGLLPTGVTTVTVTYATTSTPPLTNSFAWVFVVNPSTTLATNYAIASADTTKPGFKMRVHQIDWIRPPGDNRGRIVLAERQLANGYIDPATGQPYPNTADLTAAGPDGFFSIPDLINFNYQAPAAAGSFSANSTPAREDQLWPGIPGSSSRPTDYFVAEVRTILQLKAGGQRFGVNSDDGFSLSFGPGWDTAGISIVGSYDGTRGAGDTTSDVVIPQDGFYPVRILYIQATGGSSMEFFWYDPDTGAKVLVNDPDNLKAPRAYQDSPVSRPSISRVLPTQNYVGAFPNDDLVVDITDGNLPLGSVVLQVNNADQTVTTAKNDKVTTITRKGSVGNLLPSGLNTVRVIYSFNESGTPVTLTNTYSYTVAPYYNVLPAGNKATSGVVTSDPGFRGRVDQIDKSGDANQGNGARINGGGDSNRMPWPEVQLIGGNINPTNGLRYPNLAAKSSNNDFNYEFDLINWNMNANAVVGDTGLFKAAEPAFPLPGAHADTAFPGLPGTGTSYSGLENYVNEIQTYLELKKGVYVFGFNSDDGFIAISAPNPSDTLGTLVGFYNGGRGQSANPTGTLPAGQNPPAITPGTSSGSTLFSVIVPEDGIYPVRILYVQGGTGVNAEFYSLNKDNGMTLLVGDVAADPSAVPAYRTYNGPAKPYVKFSISPNPWDNRYQQVGPGPITMVGRTRNAVNASDIYNSSDATRPWANVAIGGVIANGTTDPNIRLLLNGVDVPATKTPTGTDLTVSYKPEPPLASGSTNFASLVYAGTTNTWRFIVQTYTNLNAADALPLTSADPNSRGFRVKMAQTTNTTGYTQNSEARAEAQIVGVLGPNVALPGTGPDGSYLYTNIINWNNNFQTATSSKVPLGNFQGAGYYGAGSGWPFPIYADEPIPGVPGTGLTTTDNTAAEVFAYLAFPTAGYYRLGVNSDDGFSLKAGLPGQTNGIVLGSYNASGGKGASDVPFSFIVPQAGLYPLRLVYHNGGGGAALECFSYDENGNKIPINDWNNAASIKAYYAVISVAKPNVTSAIVTGGNITILWVNAGTLESAPTILGPWTSTGDRDGSFTEPTTGSMKFYRVKQ
jgi:hypothetical protein